MTPLIKTALPVVLALTTLLPPCSAHAGHSHVTHAARSTHHPVRPTGKKHHHVKPTGKKHHRVKPPKNTHHPVTKGWKTYNPHGWFSVAMPGLTEQVQSDEPAGPYAQPFHGDALGTKDGRFLVARYSYPPLQVGYPEPEKMLDNTIKKMNVVKDTLQDDASQNCPGKSFLARDSAGNAVMRKLYAFATGGALAFRGPVVYMIQVEFPKHGGHSSPADTGRFFKSFHILEDH